MGKNEHALENVFEEVVKDPDGEKISVREIMEAIDNRSYGPLLLVPALITISPIGAIPGVPAIFACILILVAGQMFFIKSRPWIPQFLLERKFPRDKAKNAREKVMPVLKWVDKNVTRRLVFLTNAPFTYGIALLTVAMALAMFPLGFVPFGVMIPSLAVACFGLGLMVGDGILVALGGLISAGILVALPKFL